MKNNIKEQAQNMEGLSLSGFLKKRLRDIMNEHADHVSTEIGRAHV